jgi:mRNA interferase HigB
MRIIKKSVLAAYWEAHPDARSSLLHWHGIVKAASWLSLRDVRLTFPHADAVTVRSGRTVVVFNIAGNKHRLVAAIHYNRQLVFTLIALPHSEYSKDRWKDIL